MALVLVKLVSSDQFTRLVETSIWQSRPVDTFNVRPKPPVANGCVAPNCIIKAFVEKKDTLLVVE